MSVETKKNHQKIFHKHLSFVTMVSLDGLSLYSHARKSFDPQYSGDASQSPSAQRTSGENLVTSSFSSGCALCRGYSLRARRKEESRFVKVLNRC